jgi:hypothetical protein
MVIKLPGIALIDLLPIDSYYYQFQCLASGKFPIEF